MATTREEIREWLEEAIEKDCSHLIVVCDTYDWEDYPVFVLPTQDVKQIFKDKNGPNMQKVMEVYSLKLDIEEQLKETRSFHFD